MTIPKDWPAFPRAATYSDGMTEIWPGMTLRQWYAGMAVQGLCADSKVLDKPSGFARASFAIADAMLAHEAKEAADGN